MTPKLRTALFAVVGVFGMTGLGYASVPLYRVFCQVTGLNGTTQRAAAAPGGVGDKVVVAFDTNVSPKLPWTFKRSEEHTSELQSLMRTSYAVFCVNKKI